MSPSAALHCIAYAGNSACAHTQTLCMIPATARSGVRFHWSFDLSAICSWHVLHLCTLSAQRTMVGQQPVFSCFTGLPGSSAGMPSGSSASASSSGNGQTYTSSGQGGAMSMSSSSGDAAYHLTDGLHIVHTYPCVCMSVCICSSCSASVAAAMETGCSDMHHVQLLRICVSVCTGECQSTG